jgi:hypothetical protein
MLTFAAFLLAAPAPAAAPQREVLDAFKDVCWAVPDAQRIADSAAKQGWSPVSRGKNLPADRLRDVIEGESKEGRRVRVHQFSRAVGGRQLLLTVFRGELTAAAANGFGSTNCQVRELDGARPLSMALVEEWLGGPPDEVDEDAAGSIRTWYSHRRREPTIVTIAYIPSGSPLAGEEMMPGIYLNAEAYGDRFDALPPGAQRQEGGPRE